MIATVDRARARRALTSPSVVLFLALLASQAGVVVLTPILVDVARDLDVSTAAAGQLRTVTGLVAGAVALAFGRTARSVPLRDLLLVGAGLLALGSLVSASAPSFAVLAAAQVPVAVAVALIVSAGAAAAAEWASPERRTRVLSWTLVGPAAAWVVGMPLVGLAAERSWRLSFLVLPLAASVVVAFALTLCRKEELAFARPLVRVRDLVGDPLVGAWALAELLAASAWAGTLVYAGALFVESYETSPTGTGLILGAIAVAYLPGNFLAARVLRGVRSLALLPGLSAAGAAGIVVFGAVRPSVLVSGVVLGALAFLMGARTLAGGTLGLDLAGERRLAVMGLRASAMQFGYLVGSAAGGLALLVWGYGGLGGLLGSLFVVATGAYVVLAARSSGPE